MFAPVWSRAGSEEIIVLKNGKGEERRPPHPGTTSYRSRQKSKANRRSDFDQKKVIGKKEFTKGSLNWASFVMLRRYGGGAGKLNGKKKFRGEEEGYSPPARSG